MGFGDLIDRAIEPFAPQVAARRLAARAGLAQLRQFDAAGHGRRTRNWDRPSTDADAENARGIARLRASGHDLYRNNKYVNAAVRHMVADLIGDGIAPQFTHDDPAVAAKVQSGWDRWAESKVDGRDDFYGHEKVAAMSMIVGGEALTFWKADDDGPDGRIVGLEGDHLDQSRIEDRSDGSRAVQGVEFDRNGDRAGYWLFDRHPGGMPLFGAMQSVLRPERHIDHLFERSRFGQTRGISWLAASALDLKDIGDIEDAVRQQQKVQACLGLILVPGEGNAESPLVATDGKVETDRRNGRQMESIAPGMIYRGERGDSVSTINPSQSGGAVEFIRQQLAACSAVLAPYHRMTGDVSQANYSSLRAAMLGMWALLDDWQQNLIIPHLVRPAVNRRLARMRREMRDPRVLECGVTYALPIRRFVDPIKDLMAELIEIRAGIKTLSKSLAERGINSDDHLKEIARVNEMIDSLKLVLDSDPRRTNDAGAIQAAVGYLSKGDAARA